MSWVRRSPVVAAGVLALCACNQSAEGDAGTELDQQAGSFALLSVERFVDGSTSPRLVAGAKVARYRGIQGDDLLGLLGARPQDLDTCKFEGGLEQLSMGPDARVELVSVGDITVRLGESLTTLSPRVFPALASTASGYFYAGDAELVAPRAELDEYLLSARGEAGLGAFEVIAPAPGEVQGFSIDGLPSEGDLALSRGRSLGLAWYAEDPADRIEIELYAGGSVLSCATRDDGQFSLDVEQLAGLEPDEHGSVVVRRVRILPIDLSGVQSSYARVATTRTFDAVVR